MKKHILLILKTLFSNNACVEAARTREKKYNIIAPIFAALAIFFSVLPLAVTGFKKTGTSVTYGSMGWSYHTEVALHEFVNKTNATMEVSGEDGKHVLTITDSSNNGETFKTDTLVQKCLIDTTNIEYGTDIKYTDKVNITNWVYDIDPNPTEEPPTIQKVSTGEALTKEVAAYQDWINKKFGYRRLEIYNLTDKDDKDFETQVTNIINNKNPFKENEYMHTDKDGSAKSRNVSFIAFGKSRVYFALFQPGSTSATGFYGDYNNTATGNLKDALKGDDASATLTKFQTFLNEAYKNNNYSATWKSAGILIGVDAGVIIFMGLMIFVLTRGKNNPFRIYSFWDGQKIAFYASFTPGLIGLLGFAMSNMAMMLFILSLGIRVMWLSMRTLRYNGQEQK